jgi:hypothetical protein
MHPTDASPEGATAPECGPILTPRAVRRWRGVQVAVWLVGAGIFAALLFAPRVGLHAFWNVLIPVAPALLAFAPGLWRDICPLASTALLPRHLGWSARRRMPQTWQDRLLLVGTVVLLLVVPLRHVVLNLDGPATALAIGAMAVVAVTMGFAFEWKSGWCSSLCPVHPVERLYGQEAGVTLPNAHCDRCHRCTTPCPDSTPAIHPLTAAGSGARRAAGVLLVGGFAGYIVGWFLVPDRFASEGWAHMGSAFGLPILGLAISLVLFLGLRRWLGPTRERVLVLAFAAAAIAAYYAFRLPMLFGFGPHPGDGMLVDLRGALPDWAPWASRLATTALFGWWFLGRARVRRSWERRPAFA